MCFKEYIIKKPFILVGLLLVFLGILLFLIGQSTIQELLINIIIFVFILILVFSALVTYFTYKGNGRPFDSLIVPLYSSVFLICMTLFLMIFFTIFKTVYINSLEPELNHIIFPLAILALGMSLYYFFVAQFSTDKKLDLIIKLINEKSEPKKIEPEICKLPENDMQKDYTQISEEDKLVFEHLFQRHNNLLLFIDALDTKFSQIIALNGLILSFILIKSSDVKNIYVYAFGLCLIIVTIIIGVYGYKTRECLTGAHEKFFSAYDNFQPGVGIKKLKDRLILDIEANTETQNQKADIFNKMLIANVIALIIVIIGYYV